MNVLTFTRCEGLQASVQEFPNRIQRSYADVDASGPTELKKMLKDPANAHCADCGAES